MMLVRIITLEIQNFQEVHVKPVIAAIMLTSHGLEIAIPKRDIAFNVCSIQKESIAKCVKKVTTEML